MRAGGRKKLKQGALLGQLELQPGQCITRVVSLRGSNIVEVEDANYIKILCLLPAKFNKSLWIKKGSFVVVEEGQREKALEAGSKVTGIICHVLFDEQIRSLKRTSSWPRAFSNEMLEPSSESSKSQVTYENEDDSEDDLPPLEANANRRQFESKLSGSSDEDE